MPRNPYRRALQRAQPLLYAAIVAALVLPGAATAATPDYSFTSAFGDASVFNQPRGIAVSQGGTVYVTDYARVKAFALNGQAQFQWGSEGQGNGQFFTTYGVAVDEHSSSRDVYVADGDNQRVQKFSASGAFEATIGPSFTAAGGGPDMLRVPEGIAVTSDSIWVADTGNHRIVRFNFNGIYRSQILLGGEPGNIAVTDPQVPSTQRVFVVEPALGKIEVYEPNGTDLGPLGGPSGPGHLNAPTAIAADADGNLFVTDAPSRVVVFNTDRKFVTQFGSQGSGDGEFNGTPTGIALDSEGDLFVLDAGNHRVEKFAPTPFRLDIYAQAYQPALKPPHKVVFYVEPNRDCTIHVEAWIRVGDDSRFVGRDTVAVQGLTVVRFHHTFSSKELAVIAAAPKGSAFLDAYLSAHDKTGGEAPLESHSILLN
jgi:sugar lactone lactonase YvrE